MAQDSRSNRLYVRFGDVLGNRNTGSSTASCCGDRCPICRIGAATTIRLAMRLKTRNRRIVRVGPAEELDFTHADLVGHRGILAFFTTA